MLSLNVLSFTTLSLVTYLISPPVMLLLDHATTCHLPLLWYHLSPASYYINTWLAIITFTEILYLLSCIIYTVTWIYSTHILMLYMYDWVFTCTQKYRIFVNVIITGQVFSWQVAGDKHYHNKGQVSSSSMLSVRWWHIRCQVIQAGDKSQHGKW